MCDMANSTGIRIIKRDKKEVLFDKSKIYNAILKANKSIVETERVSEEDALKISEEIQAKYQEMKRTPTVEDVQDMVEMSLMNIGKFKLAKNYITYRYERARLRAGNTTDAKILSLVDLANEEVLQENSNKSPIVNSTQRDYIAGETSRDITERLLLPPDIVDAHRKGIIHFHDSDYYIEHMFNCCLVNLEDMLQNGTVISDTLIEKPHSFATACNIATQIIAQVASNQYGGQTITLTHLAPFVDISRQKHRTAVRREFEAAGIEINDDKINEIAEMRLKTEIKSGVQTIQYQINTLLTTNGQTPFVTIFMYLNETDDPKLKKDLAMIIEETLNQRYEGTKNEEGVWITPAFPKLIYCLDEDNVTEGSEYWYLTKLAAKCTARRMVPDYISAKMMRKLKIDKNGNGNVYPCMGCRSFLTPYVTPDTNEPKYYGRLTTKVEPTLNHVNQLIAGCAQIAC